MSFHGGQTSFKLEISCNWHIIIILFILFLYYFLVFVQRLEKSPLKNNICVYLCFKLYAGLPYMGKIDS